MTQIADTHDQAMRFAEEAFVADLHGDDAKAQPLLRKAFELERQAAELLFTEFDVEPTRSVLFRSAATLAQRCGEHREAERLIAMGLSGRPPEEIADELRDLLETVHLERHLAVRGMRLDPCELQMALAGPHVGYGLIESNAFLSRGETVKKLLARTAERKSGLEFREHGTAPKAIVEQFEQYLSVPRAASFAVSIRFGGPERQLPLPGFTVAEQVIEEVVECLRLFHDGSVDELRQRVVDDAYRRNFTALARRLAPDGRRVTSVGFTALRRGKTSAVALDTVPSPIWTPAKESGNGKVLDLTGELKLADSTKSKHNVIGLVDQEGKQHKIQVPSGMLADIVRPLWEERVQVTVQRKGQQLHLVEIGPANDSATESRSA